jgi:uncharacterized protein YaaN involved in tellurite resistance
MTDHPTTERMPTGSPDVTFDARRPPPEPPELQALRESIESTLKQGWEQASLWAELATRLESEVRTQAATIRRLEAQVDDLRQRLMQALGDVTHAKTIIAASADLRQRLEGEP